MPFDDKELRTGYTDILLDLNVDSPYLTIVFAGMNRRLYEFDQFAGPSSRIYLRDRHYAWYQRGVGTISGGVPGVVDYLQNQIDHVKPQTVLFLGNSSGGMGALLFGCLLGHNPGVEVHAFSPQTFVHPIRRSSVGDHRWIKALSRRIRKNPLYPLHLVRLLGSKFNDIKPLMYDRGAQAHIYYAQDNPIDRIHSERLGTQPGVTLHPIEYAQHDLVRYLTATGQMSTIFNQIYGLVAVQDSTAS